MPHSVQFASTSDGVGIAYWAIGDGIPLVIPPIIVSSHLEIELQIPSRRAVYEGLARDARVVRYDCRGMGMSQRDAIDFSVEAAMRDLEAVVDKLGFETFALLRLPSSGDVCFAYAAAHPERVSHLIVWEGHSVQDDLDPPRRKQLEAIEPVLDRKLGPLRAHPGADHRRLGRLERADHRGDPARDAHAGVDAGDERGADGDQTRRRT